MARVLKPPAPLALRAAKWSGRLREAFLGLMALAFAMTASMVGAHVNAFTERLYARIERDAWLNWPARISGQMASTLGVDAHQMHVALEAAVREHLIELGELRPRVD